jgi:hypothetical protein
MLEDSNALVFMEAIKSVEYLSSIMGKLIKQQKAKQFIALLTDKVKVLSKACSIKRPSQPQSVQQTKLSAVS